MVLNYLVSPVILKLVNIFILINTFSTAGQNIWLYIFHITSVETVEKWWVYGMIQQKLVAENRTYRPYKEIWFISYSAQYMCIYTNCNFISYQISIKLLFWFKVALSLILLHFLHKQLGKEDPPRSAFHFLVQPYSV